MPSINAEYGIIIDVAVSEAVSASINIGAISRTFGSEAFLRRLPQ
jgi:hypothetical protein